MKRAWLEIYALGVCFFTVACLAFVVGLFLWNLVAVVSPEFTLSDHEWSRHQSDDAFRSWLVQTHRYGPERDTYVAPEGLELTQVRERSFAAAISSEVRSGQQSLVRYLIIMLVDLVLLAVHWKIAARARASGT